MAILYTLRVFARNLLRGNRRKNTFRISFWCLAWGSNPGFSSNKPTHYLLDHGEYNSYDLQTLNIWFKNFNTQNCYKLAYWIIFNKGFAWQYYWQNALKMKHVRSVTMTSCFKWANRTISFTILKKIGQRSEIWRNIKQKNISCIAKKKSEVEGINIPCYSLILKWCNSPWWTRTRFIRLGPNIFNTKIFLKSLLFFNSQNWNYWNLDKYSLRIL